MMGEHGLLELERAEQSVIGNWMPSIGGCRLADILHYTVM